MEGFVIVILIFIFGAFFGYIKYINNESKKALWRSFARNHNLTFMPGTFFGSQTRVMGIFREHQLELDAFERSRNKRSITYTRLKVWANSKRAVITPERALGERLQLGELLDLLTTVHNMPQRAELTVSAHGQQLVYEEKGLITEPSRLERIAHFLSDVADNYPSVMTLGGEAMFALQQLVSSQVDALQPVAEQLMLDIAAETTARLAPGGDGLLCPHCLLHCIEHKVALSWWRSISYYGCRGCHQSRTFLRGQSIAVLDQGMSQTRIEKRGVILVNWLQHRQIFDFSGVYIGQASDEEVERFAVQIGNDTDERRKARYAQLRCLLSPDAPLSENSQRILRRTFENVVVTDLQLG